MKRRDFLKKAGLGAATAAAATAGIIGCAKKEEEKKATPTVAKKTYEWKMVTTWPPKFPVLQIGAERFAKRVEQASEGRIKIQVFAGGE